MGRHILSQCRMVKWCWENRLQMLTLARQLEKTKPFYKTTGGRTMTQESLAAPISRTLCSQSAGREVSVNGHLPVSHDDILMIPALAQATCEFQSITIVCLH